ncbi:MAG TPA: UDP-3-O-(3-hydroxymyristoyl)glucosamine N-acyltransferase [Fimbriimonas sp.]|nr:UDP-3-O-(3-hydroxymyristoyl)glucosamine N-acyltransferase [Fimbriimonas sp.]
MDSKAKGWTLAELASELGGEMRGPADLVIARPVEANGDDPHGLAFAESAEYLRTAIGSNVGAVLTKPEFDTADKPAILAENPREAFARFLTMCLRPLPFEVGIHPTAVVSESASVSPLASVGPYAVVEALVVIEDGVRVYPGAYIGEECQLRRGATVYPHAVLYQNVEVGERSIIHSHAVIGADGFGFTWNGEKHVKIPQVGRTVIGADVEVGACTTIDRAMMGETRIGDGTKIDNQVQIGHNTQIGPHTVIAAQAGISGSCTVGARCTFAGQTAMVDHCTLGDDVTLTGRAATSADLLKPGAYRGAPALPYMEQLRYEASLRRVPDLMQRVRELEKKLEALEKQSAH